MKPTLPLVIAHRGASAETPENTIAAFERAVELGAEAIELDVQVTRDGVPVVTHNDDLSILTGYKGFVHAVPFSTIRELDAGSHFGKKWKDEKIPTLADALTLIGHHRLRVIIEIKQQPLAVAEAVARIGEIVVPLASSIAMTIASFSPKILLEMKRLFPELPRALIINRGPLARARSARTARRVDSHTIMAPYAAPLGSLVRQAHRVGRSIYVWTVNKPELVPQCLAMQVDGIITDNVAMVKKHLYSPPHYG
ncbi:MAG: hypothetical protein HY465_04170 [Deltaproteobacteria bacterium]|nr:hypothetical protein [Deltaproteobacteria bacterium]